ncbi:unnamed protein product [Vicia faba]|uniref:Uncharacterized protein n=1 Tax=Vicia faba TaxID=3906 RepID=A0AAV0Z3H0_VICFA|nr:unnamed protein product [Vicia faba]
MFRITSKLTLFTMAIIRMHLFTISEKILKRMKKVVRVAKIKKNIGHRYGGKGHWGRTCRTPKHLGDLYQKSLKSKNIRIEIHFSNKDGDPDYDNMDVTHLEIGDFFVDLDGKIDHLIGDGTFKK